uniref:DUF2085 domain-containing protein n=1 Tax=Cyanothece sp. (strain PCC 7425 / ATCC 29141) TaxID=395961 RepID=B8HQW8_CYAP4
MIPITSQPSSRAEEKVAPGQQTRLRSVQSLLINSIVEFMQTGLTPSPSRHNVSWRSLIADVVLAGLVSGPVAAPFLAASSLPLLPGIADIIYFMGQKVCPQPEMGLMLSPPWLMAVCMRCYGTVLALLLTRWLCYRTEGKGAFWLAQYGLPGWFLSIVLMLFYPLEYFLQQWDVWGYENAIVFPFGAIAGLGLGLLIMPLLHQQGFDGQNVRSEHQRQNQA